MREKAAQILILLKSDKSFSPGFIMAIAFFITSYLLYPHDAPKVKAAAISDSKIMQTKPTSAPNPTLSLSSHKNSQNIIDTVPTSVASSDASSAKETAATTNNASANTNSSNNNSSTPASSSDSNSDNQNIPTPTAMPDQTNTPVDNSNIPTITPTTAPENGNVDNSVNTIVQQIIPTTVPQVQTIIANNGTGTGN